MVKNIIFGKLREVLAALGYTPRGAGNNTVVFRNPDRRLMIILPEMRDEEFVLPVDLSSTRSTLVGDGVLQNDYSFDSLFLIRKGDRLIWTDPKTGKETKVTAAAGEGDGLVVVKQNGALLPCRVDQVRRVKRAATAARK
jgi:hypothetical protein